MLIRNNEFMYLHLLYHYKTFTKSKLISFCVKINFILQINIFDNMVVFYHYL